MYILIIYFKVYAGFYFEGAENIYLEFSMFVVYLVNTF